MKTKTHEEKECDRMMVDLESIEDMFERSIATANLLSIGQLDSLVADTTVPHAAFHLYRDLQRLHKLVDDVIDRTAKSGFRAGQEEKESIAAR